MLGDAAPLDYCYLTTTGRRSGQPREIEIWFAANGNSGTLYLLAGGGEGSHWVRNIRANPAVTVRLDQQTYPATGRIVATHTDEDALARRLVFEKYEPRYSGDLTGWRESALPVALDVGVPARA